MSNINEAASILVDGAYMCPLCGAERKDTREYRNLGKKVIQIAIFYSCGSMRTLHHKDQLGWVNQWFKKCTDDRGFNA
jgi:hypothetical protein